MRAVDRNSIPAGLPVAPSMADALSEVRIPRRTRVMSRRVAYVSLLAIGLALAGKRVALLDGDIYGPTTPIMLGLETPPKSIGNRMIPQEASGLKFISMGLLVKSDQPLIWRGPMAHKALQQCLFDVEWGELDYLVVDLPPGTGDVHLTLAQAVPLTGAVIVSTSSMIGNPG